MIAEINGLTIEIVRKRIKNINLTVLPPIGRVRVSAPLRISQAEILGFIRQKTAWILKQQKKYSSIQISSTNYFSGECFLLFGKMYKIKRIDSTLKKIIDSGSEILFYFPKDCPCQVIQKYVNEYQRIKLFDELKILVEKWSKITGLVCSNWQIRIMKTRWGTCNTLHKNMWFSLQLAEKPIECIDYVVLHETAHLAIPNHGEDFKAFLTMYMENWKERRKVLNFGKNNSK